MCEFISWIEYEKKNYFLTDKDLESKEGKSLIKFLGSSFREDIKGHGAIRTYFNGGNQELGKKLQWGKENQKLAQDQLALEQAQQEQKRRTTTNLIIGGITFVIFGVAAFVVVRYIKNRNAIAK